MKKLSRKKRKPLGFMSQATNQDYTQLEAKVTSRLNVNQTGQKMSDLPTQMTAVCFVAFAASCTWTTQVPSWTMSSSRLP